MVWAEIGASLGGGALSLIGADMQNRANAGMASDARNWSAAQSDQQMGFQERMANSAHQREVADLKKAGLNPIISASRGGASTPSGSQGTPQVAKMENILSPAMTTAMQVAQTRNELAKGQSQIDLQNAQKMAAETSALKDNATAKNISTDTLIKQKTAPSVFKRAEAEQLRSQFEIDNKNFRQTNQLIQEGLGTATSAKDLINPLNYLKPKNNTPQREKWKNRDEQKADERKAMLEKAEQLFRRGSKVPPHERED